MMASGLKIICMARESLRNPTEMFTLENLRRARSMAKGT